MCGKLAEDFILVLYSNGALNSLLTAFLVVTIAGANVKSNRYFSLLLAVISLSYFYVLFLSERVLMNVPYVFGGMHKAALVFGPSLYLYFMSLIRKRFRFDYAKLLHFLPVILYTIVMMPVYISDDESKIDIYNKYIPYFRALFILIFIHFFSYMLYTYLVIKRNGVVILKKFKNVESVAINWFRYLSLLSLTLGIFCISIYVLHIFFSFNTLILNLVADLFIVILLHFLAYKGIRRIEILQYIPDTAVSKKYARSNMNQLQAENYMESVIQFVKREKNFLNSEINLKLLSSSLSISEHHLSQIFSQYMGITFNDYVNKLRIEEAKRLISERADDYPILRIGFDVGFNSKSSFNANFKKFTDMTPSEFKSEKGD